MKLYFVNFPNKVIHRSYPHLQWLSMAHYFAKKAQQYFGRDGWEALRTHLKAIGCWHCSLHNIWCFWYFTSKVIVGEEKVSHCGVSYSAYINSAHNCVNLTIVLSLRTYVSPLKCSNRFFQGCDPFILDITKSHILIHFYGVNISAAFNTS